MIFFSLVASIGYAQEKKGEKGKEADFIDFDKNLNKEDDVSLDSLSNALGIKKEGDSLQVYYAPEYLVVSKEEFKSALRPSLLDTIYFFAPPAVVNVRVDAEYDSVMLHQTSYDTVNVLLNPKFMIVDKSMTIYPEEREPLWNSGATAALGVTWVTLNNWQKGGNNTFAIDGNVRSYANRKIGKMYFDNTGELAYGYIKDGDIFRKYKDLFKVTALQSMPFARDRWAFSSRIYFKSQLQPGYKFSEKKETDPDTGEEVTKIDKTLLSSFLSPADLEVGIGVSYNVPKKMNLLFSIAKGKMTFVLDDDLSDKGAFGVPKGKHSRGEIGLGFDAQVFKMKPIKNVEYQGNFNFFWAYKKDSKADYNYSSLIRFYFNEHVTLTMDTRIVYDVDQIRGYYDEDLEERPTKILQVRNQLNLTFLMNWKNHS
ncbi:DUF3078 domain-containing protein [Fulvitalea axinellae]|uniref:DUF3078 domain-containing protein n=1 Tax=Fulvitalea axinellae TaxID=1182444 RepID=UPI0030CA5252